MKMKKITKEVRKALCALMAVAMVFTNTGMTVFAEESIQAEETQQELRVEETEEASTDKLSLEEEMTEEAPDKEEMEELESEEKDSDTEDAFTEKSIVEKHTNDEGMEDISEEDTLTEETLSEVVSTEETVSEDSTDMEETEAELKVKETVQKLSFSDTDIANGEYKEDGNDITWVIDADRKLTVEGTGDFAVVDSYSYDRAPWYEKRSEIKTAEINVTGMKDASYMFYGCSSLTDLDISGFDTSSVTNMEGMFFNCRSLSSIYTPRNLELSVELPSDEGEWYDIEEKAHTELPTGLLYSVLLTKGAKPTVSAERIKAVKTKTSYYVGDTVNTDDIIVRYYGSDATVKILDAAYYTVSEVDLLTAGVKTLTITYKTLTTEIKLTVSEKEEGGDTEESGSIESSSTESSTEENSSTESSSTEESSTTEESSKTEESSTTEESSEPEGSSEPDEDDSPYPSDKRTDLKSANAAIAAIKTKVYDRNAYEPVIKVTVTIDGKTITLTEGADYCVLYKDNINAGTATAIVRGNGTYKGEITQTFTISKKSVKKLKVLASGVVGTADLQTLPVHVYDGTKLLEQGKDYTLSNYKTTKPSAAEVTVTGAGNYEGTVTAKLAVYESGTQFINPENVKLKEETVSYTGKAMKPEVTVTVNGAPLTTQDYKVQYQNNKDAGTAFVVVTGKGEYTGKVVKSFEITAAKASLTIDTIPTKTFNGKLQKPAMKVKAANKKLKANKDYTVTYGNNFHHGKATVLIIGKGNYEGTAETSFTIEQQKISKASVKGTKETGIILTYNKRQLSEGIDYTIEYSTDDNGSDLVAVTGIGDFTGKMTKTLKSAKPENDASIVSSNKNKQNYTVWSAPMTSYLTENEDNTMMRVEYIKGKVWAETYSSDRKLLTQTQLTMELPLFGGFYAGKDNYFLVFGQKNPTDDDSIEVIRVVKYDKEWNRQGAASLFGANTSMPFEAGSLRMTACGDMLYIRTCHQMYKSDDGLKHQANLTFCVKISDMEITDKFFSVANIRYGYVSHSFNQFILTDNADLVAVDHGDAYPRSVVLVRYSGKAGEEKFTDNSWWSSSCENVNVLPIQGNIGANSTGVSIGGLEASETAYLVAGNSVPQNNAGSYNASGVRNIFVTGTSKSNFTSDGTTLHWITNYTDNSTVKVSTPQMVKLNSKEFVLMWAEGSQVKCVLLNASGEPVTGIYSTKGSLSDCQPILIGGRVVWYYTNNSKPVFSSLNIEEIRGVSK